MSGLLDPYDGQVLTPYEGQDSPTTLPEGTKRFEFGGMQLHEITLSLTDSRTQRIAVHEFDRRNGAQTEWMGRGPASTRCELVFIGASGFKQALRLAAMLDENPTRDWVHPIYGAGRVTCKGFDSAKLDAHESNIYKVPVEFIEANLDGKIVAAQAQGASSKAGKVTSTAATINARMADAFLAIGAVTIYIDQASAFAALALAAANAGLPSPALPGLLAGVIASGQAAFVALGAVGTPEAADIASTCEILLAQCRDLGVAVISSRPPLEVYIVPSDMPLLAIASRLYGPAGAGLVDAILADNPHITNAALVRAGTVLRVARLAA